MPGALTWDPTPAGGAVATARGAQNPAADGASLSAAEVAAARALVSADGNVTAAALPALMGTPGQVVRLSDGADQGAPLIWAKPSGSSTYAWCWFVWPQSAYF